MSDLQFIYEPYEPIAIDVFKLFSVNQIFDYLSAGYKPKILFMSQTHFTYKVLDGFTKFI